MFIIMACIIIGIIFLPILAILIWAIASQSGSEWNRK